MALERPQIEKPEGDIPFELGIEDVVLGDGEEAVKGNTVAVHYVGVAFRSGEEFDASWDRGRPFEFKLGAGRVIPGWDAGVAGMRVGGRRKHGDRERHEEREDEDESAHGLPPEFETCADRPRLALACNTEATPR